MTQEALKLALDALETELSIDWGNPDDFDTSAEKMHKAIAAIKEALAKEKALQALHSENEKLGLYKDAYAQPEQQPRNVRERWNVELDGNDLLVCFNDHEKGDKCQYERYLPQRTWVGLFDEEIEVLFQTAAGADEEVHIRFARAIESKLKEINT